MIVSPIPEGWKVFFHRSHALLAAQIALQWKREEGIERVAETIRGKPNIPTTSRQMAPALT